MSDSKVNQFHGLSTLRAKEYASQGKSEHAKALESYLHKYGNDQIAGEGSKKKKKRKKRSAGPSSGLRMIDRDETGFAEEPKDYEQKVPSFEAFMDEGEEDGDAPVIANPGEADLYSRLAAKEKSGAALQNWETVVDDMPRPSKRRRHDSPDASPVRRQRHGSPDASSPRRQRLGSPDTSPPRRQRHDSPDTSPPRRQRHGSPDASSPRRHRQGSPDASAPRRQRHGSPDVSPPRRRRHDSPDASPPRRQRHDNPDASPPRRQRHDNPDASPALRSSIMNQVQDPSKTTASGPEQYPDRLHLSRPSKSMKKSMIMSDGTVAGMVSGAALAAEMEKKRAAERLRFAKLEAASGSRNAATVYRNAETGAQMTREQYEASAKLVSDKKKLVYEVPEWGGGVRQMRDREQRAEDRVKEALKPFARTKDDVDQELNLRDRARFGDPMAHLVRQKEAAPPPPVIPERMVEQMKKSGFVVPQEVPLHSWIKRNLGPPPNRYSIRPGRHWDGVDRSTGFERDMFKMQASRAALDREARAWAQADM